MLSRIGCVTTKSFFLCFFGSIPSSLPSTHCLRYFVVPCVHLLFVLFLYRILLSFCPSLLSNPLFRTTLLFSLYFCCHPVWQSISLYSSHSLFLSRIQAGSSLVSDSFSLPLSLPLPPSVSPSLSLSLALSLSSCPASLFLFSCPTFILLPLLLHSIQFSPPSPSPPCLGLSLHLFSSCRYTTLQTLSLSWGHQEEFL